MGSALARIFIGGFAKKGCYYSHPGDMSLYAELQSPYLQALR